MARSADDGTDQLAILVAEHDLRAEQIRSALIAAAQVDSVAARAVDLIQGLAARDERRVAGRALLRGKYGLLRRDVRKEDGQRSKCGGESCCTGFHVSH